MIVTVMHEPIFWNWDPLVGVGPFRLNDKIDDYVEKFGLGICEFAKEPVNWDIYEIENYESNVRVSDGFIVGVACYDEFFIGKDNIIGLTLEDAKKTLGQPSEEEDDEYGHYVYYFDKGLTLYMKEGIVDGVACDDGTEWKDDE